MVFPAMTENSPSPSSWASDRWSRAGTKGSWTCASGRRGSWPSLLSWRTAIAVPAMSSLAVSHGARARGMTGRGSGGESYWGYAPPIRLSQVDVFFSHRFYFIWTAWTTEGFNFHHELKPISFPTKIIINLTILFVYLSKRK